MARRLGKQSECRKYQGFSLDVKNIHVGCRAVEFFPRFGELSEFARFATAFDLVAEPSPNCIRECRHRAIVSPAKAVAKGMHRLCVRFRQSCQQIRDPLAQRQQRAIIKRNRTIDTALGKLGGAQ